MLFGQNQTIFGKKKLNPCNAGVGIIIDLKLSRDYSEWWQSLILQGFRCLVCSAGVCEYTGQSGGLCPGGFRGGCGMARSCAAGTAGWMQHLQHQAAIPAAELGKNHSISGVDRRGVGVCYRNSSLGRAGEGFSHCDFCFILQM